VDIETLGDLGAILKEIGYTSKAITEIAKWYESEHLVSQ